MAKKLRRVRRAWSKDDIKELKAHSRAKTPVVKIAKATKRSALALRHWAPCRAPSCWGRSARSRAQ